jgi:hypothetical protein
MPIVPGTNPALQTWNGQNFVVSDGSAQNRISLPFLQVNGGSATYVIGADNNGTLSYYNPAFGGTALNIFGGNTGSVPYQTAPNTTTFLPIGTTGQVLKVSNTGTPVWSTPLAPTAQNIAGGAAGEIVYQTATNTTGFTAQGTTGQVLTSGGTSSPAWIDQSSLVVGTATNFSGSLSGDVTGNQNATSVSLVGGVTAANVATGSNAANAATNLNTVSTIVKRDASGNFSAGTITASLSGNSTTATSATTATTATNIDGGLAGSLPYQTAVATTTTLGIGSANQLLTVNSGATAPIWQTGIKGITDASNAASGFVGQTISGTLSFTGTTTNAIVRCVETIAVNAGDWDIYACVTFSYSGTTTAISTIGASIGTSTNAFTPLQQTIQLVGVTAALNQTDAYSFVTPTIRANVSATTNYYVVIKLPLFSVGTVSVSGSYRGRRVR